MNSVSSIWSWGRLSSVPSRWMRSICSLNNSPVNWTNWSSRIEGRSCRFCRRNRVGSWISWLILMIVGTPRIRSTSRCSPQRYWYGQRVPRYHLRGRNPTNMILKWLNSWWTIVSNSRGSWRRLWNTRSWWQVSTYIASMVRCITCCWWRISWWNNSVASSRWRVNVRRLMLLMLWCSSRSTRRTRRATRNNCNLNAWSSSPMSSTWRISRAWI